jgi:hypothetical protein
MAGPFFTVVGGAAGFLFGGEVIEGAVGAWDLLVGGGEATEGAAAAADAQGEYNLTRTVEGNAGSRPYVNSPLTIQQIEATGGGVADPGGIPGALRYDVPGSFNGNTGTYELVVDPKTNTVYHFLFKTGH